MRRNAGIALGYILTLAVTGYTATGSAPAAKKASAAYSKQVSVKLPAAHAGETYAAILALVSTIPYGRAQCTFDHGPSWLIFDPNHFSFSGVPDETDSRVYTIVLTMADSGNAVKPEQITLQLPVIAGTPVVYADPKMAPPAPRPQPAEGHVQVMAMEAVGHAQAPGTQTAVKAPAPGAKPAENGIAAPEEIPYPEIYLSQEPTPVASSIAGHVEGIASPAIAATLGDKGQAISPQGNLPLIALEILDPVNGISRASFQGRLTGSQISALPVGADGTFSGTLTSPLTPGVKIRLIPLAPNGHFFNKEKMKKEKMEEARRMEPPSSAPQSFHSDEPIRGELDILSSLSMVEPVITSQLMNNTTTISGTATASQTSTTINVGVRVLQASQKEEEVDSCLTMDNLEKRAKGTHSELAILTASSGTAKTVATTSTGSFSLTLASPLFEGEKVQVVQILPAGIIPRHKQSEKCNSIPYAVRSVGDWGRVHADFVAGLLISNNSAMTAGTTSPDNGNFSQAHQFLSLTVEKAWALPGCYLRTFATEMDKVDQCYDLKKHRLSDASRTEHWVPGFTSYFETRLTAIPVTSVSGSTTSSASGSTASPSSNFLTSAQTARVGTGIYFPFLVTRWEYHRQPNALFFAPLAKIGFDTVTGPSKITVTSATPGASSQTVNLEQLYNFHSYGARIGHFAMTKSLRRAPETNSYLDITIGQYSNLESYICHQSSTTSNSNAGTLSSCKNDYASFYSGSQGIVDSRKRLYRLDFEGLLKIPSTPLYVGFNANLGQKTLGATHLDHGYTAPDDLRFLFGTKFDISTMLQKLGVTNF